MISGKTEIFVERGEINVQNMTGDQDDQQIYKNVRFKTFLVKTLIQLHFLILNIDPIQSFWPCNRNVFSELKNK